MRAEARHQLKQDRFNKVTIGAAEATFDRGVANKGKLLVAAIVVLAVIGVIVGGWYYTNQRNDAAGLSMEQADRTLQTPVRPAGMPASQITPALLPARNALRPPTSNFRQLLTPILIHIRRTFRVILSQ